MSHQATTDGQSIEANPRPHANHAVLPDSKHAFLDGLAAALEGRGCTVGRACADKLPFAAFMEGAGMVVLEPSAAASVEATWMAMTERAPAEMPVCAILLPIERRAELGAWLAAGFEEALFVDDDPALAAARLHGRLLGRAVHHSLATLDPLTGLVTREVFFARLDPSVRLSSRASMPMAVTVLDLDGFRALEDKHGREVARRVLCDIAAHLESCLRRSDTIARLGDDRFGLILHRITAFEARRLLYKLWKSTGLSNQTLEVLGDGDGHVTFTAGVAVFPGDASSGDELYTRASLALDVARATGQRRVQLYSETAGDSGTQVHGTDLRYHRVQDSGRDEPE